MMHSDSEAQNFWPGYLDALINVMLNLLFLVAIFALGLVSLNLQSMTQLKQISRLNEQTTQVLETMDLSQAQRDAILRKLESLNISAMVEKREELDREKQSSTAQKITKLAPQKNTNTVIVETAEIKKNDEAITPHSPTEQAPNQPALLKFAIQEKKRKLEELDVQIKEAKSKLAKEKVQLLAAQTTRTLTPPDTVIEIKTAAKPENSDRAPKGGNVVGVRDALMVTIGIKPQAIWEFPPGNFVWPTTRALPDGFQTADKAVAWNLLGFIDTSNARVRREVFARMQAIRDLLIDRGFTKNRIQLELRPLGESQNIDEQAHRLIFMLPQS
jgi:uncharacterized coiled-coil protein SlyX